MLYYLTRIVFFIAGLLLLAISTVAAEIREDSYEIYMGDIDGDGDDDFYFLQKPWYLILHGDIATPILMQSVNFAVRNNGGIYSAPAVYSLGDLVARVNSGSLKKAIWNHDVFLVTEANGGNTILIRGAYASSPALLLKSFSSSSLPTVAATYSTATHRGISDRGVPLRIIDVNRDGINDVVLGSFGSSTGEYAYLGNSDNVHSQYLVRSSTNGTLVGAIQGQFRVDEVGAATYTIPLAVPEGVAGVSPELSINYSSQNGSGLVGYGGNISGLGVIARCRQTLLQDGVAKPITWGAEDRFCLNGQRLMLVSGVYGAAGSTYKTEIDSFVKVTALGGVTGTPDYFEVEAKDGSKTIYGGAQDSKLLQGARVVHWAQSRFEDNVGNRIDFTYEGDYLTRHRIKTIYYAYPTPRTSSGSNARIEFSYSQRPDVSDSYTSGGVYFKSNQILNSVISYNGPGVFRQYNFFYNEINYSSADELSRLTSVEECTSASWVDCYRRTRFTWGTKNLGFESSGVWLNTLPSKIKDYRFFDFNGDGRKDFLWVYGSGKSRTIEYGAVNRYSSGGIQKQFFSNNVQSLNFTVPDAPLELEIDVFDINGDGR